MNSYALLEDVLVNARQRSDDPWQATNHSEEVYDMTSECGYTISDMHPEISRRNSRRSSTLSLHSYSSVDTLLDIKDPPNTYHGSLGVYLAGCRRYNQVPVAVVQENLLLNELTLSHQNMNDSSIKALVLALTVNDCVTHLDVSHNRITIDGLSHIKHLMLYNRYISYLDVSHNQIGSKGLKHLCAIIRNNTTLKSLFAAGNNFGPGHKFTVQFTKSIQNCVTLHQLDMGYNQFGEESGPAWAAAIADNYGLKILVLKWNHLRWRGAMIMLEALAINDTLTTLDIAWNGIADEGAAVIARVLMTNTTLTDLDLTCNRISFEGAVTLCEGLRFNNTLQILKMNNNPITTLGASHFLLTFQTYSHCGLKKLEFLDIEVDREFETLLAEIQSSTRSLEVIRGGLVIQGDLYMSSSKKRRTRLGDPLMVLFEHVKNSNLRLWDLFAQLDKDKSLSISRDEFRNGMKEANVPLDEHQIERIMDSLDKDRNGEITFEELLEGHKRYREKERKKYETLLPFILTRPSSARQNTEATKDVNAPTPRAKAKTIVSMSGFMGEALPSYTGEQRLSLPTIKVTPEESSANQKQPGYTQPSTSSISYMDNISTELSNTHQTGSVLKQSPLDNLPNMREYPTLLESNGEITDSIRELYDENLTGDEIINGDKLLLENDKIPKQYYFYADRPNIPRPKVNHMMPPLHERRRASMPVAGAFNSLNVRAVSNGHLLPEHI